MNALQILKQTKSLIATPATWCRGAAALNSKGYAVKAYDPSACRWCLLGALQRVGGHCIAADTDAYHALKTTMATLIPERSAFLGSILNDELGFEAVHAILDATILTLQSVDAA